MATPFVLGENTPKIWDIALQSNFPRHHVQRIDISPADCGFSLVSRKRSYFFMTEMTKTAVRFPVAEVVACITNVLRNNHSSIMDCFLADDDELRSEELFMAASRRRNPMPDFRHNRDLSYLLTAHEIGYYRYSEYLRNSKAASHPHLFGANMVVGLGDNPQKRLCWSASGALPTYRKNCTVYYVPHLRRWITAREKLATMGWPTYPALADQMGVALETPTPAEGRLMLGNAMHLACVGVVMLACLVSAQIL
jgi:hypothetical protein